MLSAPCILPQLLRYAQDHPRLPAHVLHVVVIALIGQMCEPHALARKVFVQVEQIKRGGRRLTQNWRENCSLEGGQGSFELGGDEAERFVFDAHAIVELKGFGDLGEGLVSR